MPRIKVTIPEKAIHIYNTKLPVLVSHINYGNHLGNDSLVSLLHEARLRLIKNAGFQNEACIENNIGLVITSLAVTYQNESLHGDDLEIDIFVTDITKTSCDLYYKISRNTLVVALASTSLLFMNFINKNPAEIPQSFINALSINKS